MQRVHNWERRLAMLVQSSESVVFQWGQYDCGMFVARWIREVTGIDVAGAIRGTYNSEATADAVFLSGHPDLGSYAAAIAMAHGMPEVAPNFARRGDVVYVNNGTTYGALGIVGLDGRFAHC